MKNSTRMVCSLVIVLLTTTLSLFSQSPTITSVINYPVGSKAAKAIHYNGSNYLLLSDKNHFYSSTDGNNWNFVITSGLPVFSPTSYLNYMVYGNGVFVTVGTGGMIYSSTDGTSWTSRSSGTTNNLNKIDYINGNFIAIGNSRTVLTSTDGITWSTVTVNAGVATNDLMSLTYGNGVYIIAGRENGSGNKIYRSATATSNSWTFYDNPMVNVTYGTESVNRIQYLKDRFFAFHSGNREYTSTDGIAWTNITSSIQLTQPDNNTVSWNSGHQNFNGLYDGSQFYFYGSTQYMGGYGSYITSTDGLNRTLHGKSAYIVPQDSRILNGRYFIVGNEGVVSSTNGFTYAHPDGGTYMELVKSNDNNVAVGFVGTNAVIYTSPDFSTWTNRSPANIREQYAAATDGSAIITAGYNQMIKSIDGGNSWSVIREDIGASYMAMAYGNGKFIVGGYDSDGSVIKYSTDGGNTWLIANNDANSYVRIKYVNNKFFAFGYDENYASMILYSEDGITWNNVTPTLAQPVLYYKDVVFDGTKYHFMGFEKKEGTEYDPGPFFTVSTATPGNAASYGNKAVISNVPEGVVLGGSYDEGALTFSNGKFTGAVIDVASGKDYLIYSDDGLSYSAVEQYGSGGIIGAYSDGSANHLLGRGNAFYTMEFGSNLPVRYNYFNAKEFQGNVVLNWSTASETGNYKFNVLHSTDGSSWKMIGTVAASNSSSINKQYSFLHADPVKGINYYRLIQVDIDGKSSAGKIVSVNMSKISPAAVIYPNPVLNELIISQTAGIKTSTRIWNVGGQMMYTNTNTDGTIRINTSTWKPGVYQVEIVSEIQKLSKTVIKK